MQFLKRFDPLAVRQGKVQQNDSQIVPASALHRLRKPLHLLHIKHIPPRGGDHDFNQPGVAGIILHQQGSCALRFGLSFHGTLD